MLFGQGEHANQAIGDTGERNKDPAAEHEGGVTADEPQQARSKHAIALVEGEHHAHRHAHQRTQQTEHDVPGDDIPPSRPLPGDEDRGGVEEERESQHGSPHGETWQPGADEPVEEASQTSSVEPKREPSRFNGGQFGLEHDRHQLVAGPDDHGANEPEGDEMNQRQQADVVEVPLQQGKGPGR